MVSFILMNRRHGFPQFCLLFCSLFFSIQAFAAITVTDVRRSSGKSIATGVTPTIYGGIAGTCTTTVDTATCDSCTTSLTMCNKSRIHADLLLQIYFKSDTATTGRPILADANKATIPLDTSSSTSIAKGDTVLAVVKWADICSRDTTAGDPTCETPFTMTAYLGVDKNGDGALGSDEEQRQVSIVVATANNDTIDDCDNATPPTEGVCEFSAYPGDGKVFIEEPGFADGFPNSTGGVSFASLRFFYSSVDFNDVTPTSGFKDIAIVANGSAYELDDRRIRELQNGTTYFFKVATVDKASNVSNITSDANIDVYCTDHTAPSADCQYMATPDEVLGLLSEDVNCFISTAAYGSSLNEKVETFRQFRNRRLLPHAWGQKFIKAYYQYGPYASRFIIEHPSLRSVSRTLLWPAWAFAWLSLKYGTSLAFVLMLLAFSLPLATLVYWRRRET